MKIPESIRAAVRTALLALTALSCAPNRVAVVEDGGGHEVEARAVVLRGTVVGPSDTMATGVTVFAAPHDYNPADPDSGVTASGTTGRDGRFALTISAVARQWTFTAIDSGTGLLLSRSGIVIDSAADTVELGQDTLQSAARIVVQVPARFDTVDAVAFLPGTPIFSSPLSSGEVALTVAPGTVDMVCYDTELGQATADGPNLVGVAIAPAQTLSLGAHTINQPGAPSGPSTAGVGREVTYAADGVRSNYGHPLAYRFRWIEAPGPYDFAGPNVLYGDWQTRASHALAWTVAGEAKIEVQARSVIDTTVQSLWSPYARTTVTEQGP